MVFPLDLQKVRKKKPMDRIKERRIMEKVEEGIHDENDEESDVGLGLSKRSFVDNMLSTLLVTWWKGSMVQ